MWKLWRIVRAKTVRGWRALTGFGKVAKPTRAHAIATWFRDPNNIAFVSGLAAFASATIYSLMNGYFKSGSEAVDEKAQTLGVNSNNPVDVRQADNDAAMRRFRSAMGKMERYPQDLAVVIEAARSIIAFGATMPDMSSDVFLDVLHHEASITLTGMTPQQEVSSLDVRYYISRQEDDLDLETVDTHLVETVVFVSSGAPLSRLI